MTNASYIMRAQKALQTIMMTTAATVLVAASLGVATPLLLTGRTSADSPVQTAVGLDTPVNLMPGNGAFVSDNNTGFYDSWDAVAGATGYEYRTATTLNDDGSLGPIIFSDNSNDAASYYDLSGSTVTLNQNGSAAGTYYWQVRAFNDDGVYSPWSAVTGVTLDLTNPVADLSDPVNGLVTGADSLTITGTASDANLSKYSYWVSDDQGNIAGNHGVAKTVTQSVDNGRLGSWNIRNLDSGNYKLNLYVSDKAGRDSYVSRDFVIDHTNPEVTVTRPADDSYFNTSNVTIRGTAYDEISGVQYVKVYVLKAGHGARLVSGSATYNSLSQKYKYRLHGLADGTYRIVVEAIDSVGNTEFTDPITITVDTAAPSVPVANVGAGTYNGTQMVTLNSSDNGSGVDSIYYTTDGSLPSKTNGTRYSSAISVANNQTITAIAYDKAGNASSLLTAEYRIIQPVVTAPVSATSGTSGSAAPLTSASLVALKKTTVGSSSTSDANDAAVTPQILATTTDGKVKGAATLDSPKKVVASSSAFLGLGWWWLPPIILVIVLYFVLGRDRKRS